MSRVMTYDIPGSSTLSSMAVVVEDNRPKAATAVVENFIMCV